MRTIPIAAGISAAVLAAVLAAAGAARSQSAPAAPAAPPSPELSAPAPPAPDDGDDLMAFGFDDGVDQAPWDDDGAGPGFAPRAWCQGDGPGLQRGGRGHGGRGMRAGRGGGPGGPGGPGGIGMMLGPVGRLLHGGARLAEELDLTSAQRDRLRDIADNAARTSIQARADMQVARLDMAKLVRADSPDRTKIAAKIDEIARMRATHQKQALDAALEARKALTAEQLEKLDDLRPGAGRGPGRGVGQGRGRAPGAGQGQGRGGL